ncbi:type VI secretion system baseplate subunit TssE [Paraburkholderia sp. A1RI-2L]|uniref:type VI secretion system baseplate subunit TssE n=1 Tax=Paraburkholderia sp. A1RI-2L TaxID=3028367 RepID=UPI003B773782
MSHVTMPHSAALEDIQRRYPPCLFDRLISGREPMRPANDARRKSLHEAVLRDLAWLLGSINTRGVNNLRDFPQIATSVLNFGIPALEHVTLQAEAARLLEVEVREAIVRFEPRLTRDSLDVQCRPATTPGGQPCLELRIEGDLITLPNRTRIVLVADFVEAGEGLVFRSRGSS